MPQTQTRTTQRLLQVRFIIGRLTYYILAVLMLVVFVYSLTTIIPTLDSIREQTGDGTPFLIGITGLLRRYALIIFFYLSSALLLWRGPKEPVTLMGSLMFLSLASFPLTTGLFDITANVIEIPVFWRIASAIVLIGSTAIAISIAYVYPDGRFFPAYMRWAIIPILFSSINYGVSFALQQSIPLLGVAFLMITIIGGLGTQVMRWRQLTGVKRQQVKLFIMGVSGFVGIQILGVFLYAIQGGISQADDLVLVAITEVVFFASYAVLLVTLWLAIIRYRLWDIDFVINRSLVYGSLTAGLGMIFLAVFFAVQMIVNAVFPTPQPVIAAAMGLGLVVWLYQPARLRLRHFIDQRFYGIELDYSQIAKREANLSLKNLPQTEKETLDVYEQLKPIGRGGMGTVYRAMDKRSGEYVALKLLNDVSMADEEALRRFQREAQVMMRIEHPNIIRLYGIGVVNEVPYIAMEYVEGESLSERLKDDKPLGIEEALQILRDIGRALEHVHLSGIIHRDIKPGNVMLEVKDGVRRAVLMDFGIAHISNATRLTRADSMVGTLEYISPEQIQASEQIDQRADLYSFGIMAYQMLTGSTPFYHNNPGALIMAHLMQPPPDPRQKQGDIPQHVAQAMMRAIEKDPKDRFQNVGEFIEALG